MLKRWLPELLSWLALAVIAAGLWWLIEHGEPWPIERLD